MHLRLSASVPEIVVLQWLIQRGGAKQGNAFLQIVALFSSNPHFFTLNGSLDFQFMIFNKFDYFFSEGAINALDLSNCLFSLSAGNLRFIGF